MLAVMDARQRMETLIYAKLEPIGMDQLVNNPLPHSVSQSMPQPQTEAQARAQLRSLARRMGADVPEG